MSEDVLFRAVARCGCGERIAMDWLEPNELLRNAALDALTMRNMRRLFVLRELSGHLVAEHTHDGRIDVRLTLDTSAAPRGEEGK